MPSARVRSKAELLRWIKHRQTSTRGVAAGVNLQAKLERLDLHCSHSTIGHLVNPNHSQVDTHADKARLIEKVLDVPTGSLFAYEVARGSLDKRQFA